MSSAARVPPGGLADNMSVHGSTEALSSSAVNRMLLDVLLYLGRAVVLCYPVYLTGYLGLSVSWVLLCMVMITWWKKNRQWKDVRIGSAIKFVDDERIVIDKELQGGLQMASWIHFPDEEKVDWVNKVLEQAWPFFGMFMEKLLRNNIQPAVRQSSGALKTFSFTKIHFGHKPLKITGIKAYTHEVDHREVILDMNVCYESDVDIDGEVKPALTAGVKGLTMKGMLRVILEPLIGQAPLVGGVTFFFIRRPTLEINWTGMTNLLDSPAFSSLSEGTIMDIIASLMVLPNRMCFPLIDQVKVDHMRFPLPRGVVRVHLLAARNLVAKDTYMIGLIKGKSDPYATVRVGNRHFQSKTVKESLDPTWNEVYEFVVHEAPGQQLEVELFDEDTDKDDFIGRYFLDLGEVKREKELDKWYTLEGIQHGEVHLKLQWFGLQDDASLLKEIPDGFASAMLAVYLDSASNIPKDNSELTHNQKPGKISREAQLTRKASSPSSFVELSLGDDVQKSKVAFSSKDPVWEEGFTFFVHDISSEQLVIQVKEHEKKTALGILSLPLTRLLNTSNMMLDQRFLLERSGANSQIKLKATLRVLTLEKPPPKVIIDPPRDPPALADQGQDIAASTLSLPTQSSLELSSTHHPAAQASPTAVPEQNGAHSTNGLAPSRPYDTWHPPASKAMRRYDSHSLLSENSIASSRFDLSDGASYPEPLRKYQGSLGEISLTIRYATLRKKLIILVNACRNLFPSNENGTDSYVRIYLLPDQSWRHRKRTQVVRRTVNPVYNDKIEFEVPLEEAQTRMLDVSVKNNRMFNLRLRKDIGMTQIDLAQMDVVKGVSDWFELTLPGLKKSN
ncbi:extended synaptotagmin-3 [Synchiropus splendidus]|uniref:extended synaptotagmin-3 n=1 Tax=Synchiropus splendidus TaxID=270530 RepID=UPI00237E5DD1|nr:extended synaptotagmin-3 [Synchiropus splendidus]